MLVKGDGSELKTLETITEALRSELDCEPAVAMATECPPLPEGTNPKARIRELDAKIYP